MIRKIISIVSLIMNLFKGLKSSLKKKKKYSSGQSDDIYPLF
jgi:hypothetical protein